MSIEDGRARNSLGTPEAEIEAIENEDLPFLGDSYKDLAEKIKKRLAVRTELLEQKGRFPTVVALKTKVVGKQTIVFPDEAGETSESHSFLPLDIQEIADTGYRSFLQPDGGVYFGRYEIVGNALSLTSSSLREATPEEYVRFAPHTFGIIRHELTKLRTPSPSVNGSGAPQGTF